MSCPFLELPAEISWTIYENVFDDFNKDWARLLRVSKQVQHDVMATMRKKVPIILVTIALPHIRDTKHLANCFKDVNGCWTTRPHNKIAAGMFYSSSTRIDDGCGEDMHLNITSCKPVGERADFEAKLRLIGRDALLTFARRLAHWSASYDFRPNRGLQNLRYDFVFPSANAQIRHQADILKVFVDRLWDLPNVTIQGAFDQAQAQIVQGMFSNVRFNDFESLCTWLCRLRQRASNDWSACERERAMEEMTTVWEIASLSRRKDEYGRFEEVTVNDRCQYFLDFLEGIELDARLSIANMHLYQAWKAKSSSSNGTACSTFDDEIVRAQDLAVRAIQQMKNMPFGEERWPGLKTWSRLPVEWEARLILYVTYEAQNRQNLSGAEALALKLSCQDKQNPLDFSLKHLSKISRIKNGDMSLKSFRAPL